MPEREYDLPPEVGDPDYPYKPGQFIPLTGPTDLVNQPPHYLTGGIETIDFLEAKFADDPWLWQVVAYCVRCRHKGNELEDLKKARYYLERRIARLEGK